MVSAARPERKQSVLVIVAAREALSGADERGGLFGGGREEEGTDPELGEGGRGRIVSWCAGFAALITDSNHGPRCDRCHRSFNLRQS